MSKTRKVGFTETVLRDANQSLIATRLPYSKFEPILETMDKAGYYSAEVWGGATFDVCLRYLQEDPWDRLRKIRKKMPNTKLQMLLRGQNILGYKHYPDDVVRKFVEYSIKNGIDIIRIFDALNDVRNLEVAIDETNKWNGHASGTICFTTSPVHTLEKNVQMVKDLKSMGVKSICIKDMAGIMGPKESADLCKAIKDAVPELPLVIHTHCTTGLAFMTCLKGVEAGADVIDTAISPMSGGTAQPATETLAYALRSLGYQVDLDDKVLIKMADFFKGVRAGFIKDGTLDPISMATDTQCLNYQIPGGMLSNLISQLKMMNAIDKLDEALAETPKVRADMGYPPLVTPTSQMVGSQAVQNVLAGERYKVVGKEIKAYCRGEYGRTPAPINADIQKKILGNTPVVEGRFADSLEPAFEKTKAELGATARSDEDVLSYIAFPQVAMAFFKDREAGFPKKEEPKKAEAAAAPKTSDLPPMPAWQGHVYYANVPGSVSNGVSARPIQPFAANYQPPHLVMGARDNCPGTYTITIDGKAYAVSVAAADGPAPAAAAPAAPVAAAPVAAPAPAPAAPAPAPAPAAAPAPAPAAGETPVNSPMPGNVFKVECKPGQAVKAGDVLVILEAMKMEIEVTAPADGTVKSVAAAVGTAVNTDDLLVVLG
ncbi:MAG: pyruvate carboxylase subunit B [Lawsonibacter sp.]|nr:pyruvate carboxylase subunit B [Lawsonibacter sp.]